MATELEPQKKRARRFKRPRYDSKDNEGAAVAAMTLHADQFKAYQEELDCKHDKYERLVKLSRDCTIVSKRTIFLLHRISGETDKSKILLEAETKLHEVLNNFKEIASELVGEDPGKYHRAYSPGVQEFIEALSYLVFLKNGSLISLEDAQEHLTFRRNVTQVAMVVDEAEKLSKDESIEGEFEVEEVVIHKVPLESVDFVLGIADLTGELMRMCVNAIGSGTLSQPFKLLLFVRAVYCAFSSLRPVSREIPQKLRVLRNSLEKIEHVCYTLRIRGSEVPKHMLLDVVTSYSSTYNTTEDKEACDFD